jgi:hypothetical protein
VQAASSERKDFTKWKSFCVLQSQSIHDLKDFIAANKRDYLSTGEQRIGSMRSRIQWHAVLSLQQQSLLLVFGHSVLSIWTYSTLHCQSG